MTDYNEILNYIKNEKGRHWVVQKYIENPLIIESRKFDIRQWVLVEDWNPLTVWIYNECYIRFALQDYDPEDRSKFAHLTNNALVKEFIEQEGESSNSDEDMENIWSQDDFAGYLQSEFKSKYPNSNDIFEDVIAK